jgi:hypothetical protein
MIDDCRLAMASGGMAIEKVALELSPMSIGPPPRVNREPEVWNPESGIPGRKSSA